MSDLPLFDHDDPQESKLDRAFRIFHRDNPHVYALFCRLVQQVLDAGREHYSARAIAHRMRWHANFETRGDPFKINNNHVKRYARLWTSEHPGHEGFFRERTSGHWS